MEYIPMHDYILVSVQQEEKKDMTDGGLYLPPDAGDGINEPDSGVIQKLGPEVPEGALEIGERIYFDKYNGKTVTDELLLVSFTNVSHKTVDGS